MISVIALQSHLRYDGNLFLGINNVQVAHVGIDIKDGPTVIKKGDGQKKKNQTFHGRVIEMFYEIYGLDCDQDTQSRHQQ
jgi:hypothetical protein